MDSEFMRYVDGIVYSINEDGHLFSAADARCYSGEFVAAKASHKLYLPEAFLKVKSHRLQQLVADLMTERVVDGLELVSIKKQNGYFALITALFEVMAEVPEKRGAIWKLGQSVVEG